MATRTWQFVVVAAALVVVTLGTATGARAAAIIEFDDVVIHGGTVTQAGSIITGTNVRFDFITLEDGSTSNIFSAAQCGTVAGQLSTSCVLNFSFDTTTVSGTVTMTALGGVYDAGADLAPFTADTGGQILAPGSIVFSGTLTDAGFATPTVFGASGFDTLDPALLAFFNVLVTGDLALSTSEIRVARTGLVRDADAVNSGEIQLIPEPATLSLFGLGLLGVGRGLRRRR